MPIILYLDEGSLKLAVLVLIPMITLAAIEREMIDTRNILIVGSSQQLIISFECLENLLQHLFPIHLVSQDLSQRHGIGGIAQELGLIDIDANTKDATLDATGVDGGLYQRAAYLLVIPVYIIRPLERETLGVCIQRLLDG